MKRETFRRKSTRQLRSLFTPHVSRLILSRGSVGQIEYNTSDQRNNQACDEYGGKTQWRNVAVVKKGQKNGGDYGHSEAYYVTFQIDRFAWLTPHVRSIFSVFPPPSLGHIYFIRNDRELSPEAVVTVRSTRPFFPPLGTVVVMLLLVWRN